MPPLSSTTLRETFSSKTVVLREVGLREAIQAQPKEVATDTKARWVHQLVGAGYTEINPVSFVSPKAMPQMADAESLLDQIADAIAPGTRLSGLAPNQRGVDRAIAAREREHLHEAIMVTAATSSTLRNNGMTADLDARMAEIERWSALCQEADLGVIVFISAAFGCSIEGRVDPDVVLDQAEKLDRLEAVDEIVISDSTGQADPAQVHGLLTQLASAVSADRRLGLHFHDSRGAGLANIVGALLSPFDQLVFDTAFGGWGGDVPFIPEAAGNVSSEDVAEMIMGMGFDVGIDIERVIEVTDEAARAMDLTSRSRVADTGPVKWKM